MYESNIFNILVNLFSSICLITLSIFIRLLTNVFEVIYLTAITHNIILALYHIIYIYYGLMYTKIYVA